MIWITESTGVELLLLGWAFVLSVIIGLERERRAKSAGLRTHTLVGLGSALFTLVSAYGFVGVVGSDVVLDPSRIAAQIVSGVGFLGAGVIFVRQNVVAGLTTAASIWVTAAVGMACGAGMPVLAAIATMLHLLTASVLSHVGRFIRRDRHDRFLLIQYKEGAGALRAILQTATSQGFRPIVTELLTLERTGKQNRINARVALPNARVHTDSLVDSLTRIRGVVSVRVGSDEAE